MALADLMDWMDDFTGPQFIWYIKRLSGNDTLANKSHQAGPYIPRQFLFDIFPDLNQPTAENPRIRFNLYIDSHPDSRTVTAIWYNNKFKGGTRNETRLTNFGGERSALLDPESTGALAVFAFVLDENRVGTECHVWVCRHEVEEDLVEERTGPVEPGQYKIWTVNEAGFVDLFTQIKSLRCSCFLEPSDIPPSWLIRFPTGAEIIRKTIELRSDSGIDPDKRLIARRECEFEIFKSIEQAFELPLIKQGFGNIEEFIARAQTILQRRKSRSGRSLELHTREIFIEEGLREGQQFSHQPESESGQRPDFLFPSEADYKNSSFPENKLRMLAVKTTCKDRWRQVLREADRISIKHLLTLQEGVSVGQFNEMIAAGIQLVVPAPLISSYPSSVQPHLQTLESFIGDVRLLSL